MAADELHQFALDHPRALQLDPDPNLPIQVLGFHPSFHVDENGQLLAELVAQWLQTPPEGDKRRIEIGGVVMRAGTTAVFSSDGRVRYVAAKPLPGSHLGHTDQDVAQRREASFKSYAAAPGSS